MTPTTTVKEIKFYIGQEFNHDGHMLRDVFDRKTQAFKYLAEKFGGFTAVTASGGWHNPDTGQLVIEQSLVVTVLDYHSVADSKIEATAKFLAATFNQHTVLVTTQEVGKMEVTL